VASEIAQAPASCKPELQYLLIDEASHKWQQSSSVVVVGFDRWSVYLLARATITTFFLLPHHHHMSRNRASERANNADDIIMCCLFLRQLSVPSAASAYI
jgi:hypothetical protein